MRDLFLLILRGARLFHLSRVFHRAWNIPSHHALNITRPPLCQDPHTHTLQEAHTVPASRLLKVSLKSQIPAACHPGLLGLASFCLIAGILPPPFRPPAVCFQSVMFLLYGVAPCLYLQKYFKHAYFHRPLKLAYFLCFPACNLSLSLLPQFLPLSPVSSRM